MGKKLFFSLNVKKSLESKLFFIDIYYGKVKLKKNNQFTGILKKYDKKDFFQLNNEEKNILKDLELINFNSFFVLEINKKNINNLNNLKNKIILFYELENNLFLLKEIQESKKQVFEENEGFIYVNLEKIIEKIKKNPILIFKINKIIKDTLFLYLEFKYDRVTYKANNSNIPLTEIGSRNLVYEFSFILELFIKFNLDNNSKNLYTIRFQDLEEIVKKYKNIELLYKNNNVFNRVSIPNFKKIDVKESKNWISYDLDYDFSGENKNLIDQLNLYEKGWTILYKNQLYLLPPQLKETLEEIKNNNLDLKIPWYHKGILKNFLMRYNYKLEEICPYENIEITKETFPKNILKPYQITGVKWLKYLYLNNLNGCLADEMGLGKTLQVLTFLSEKDVVVSNILIICPKILIKNWENEIYKFKFNFNVIKILSSKDLNEINRRLDKIRKNIIIVSFGIVRNTEIPLKCIDYLIIDEAQNIKNILTASNQSVNALNPKFKILLTGTPLENNMDELLTLFEFLNPLLLKNIPKGIELKELIRPFLLRRTKKEVLSLPEKEIYNYFVEMFPEERNLYVNLVKKLELEFSQITRYKIKDNSLFLKMLTILRQLCCHPLLLDSNLNPNLIKESAKFEKLKLIIDNAKKNNRKIIIFSQFTKMLKIIQENLKERNIKNYYLDGKTKNKHELITDYEKDLNFSVFLISLKAGGVGITLTSAQEVVIYDSWWNPAVENQAIDRIHRIGQEKEVSVYYLYTKGTIEEKIYELKNEKNELFLEILTNQDEIINISTLKKILL